MASQAWILLGFTLLSVCISTEGLIIDMVRSPGNFYCGLLSCVNDVDQEVSSFTTKSLVVYQISAGGSRSRLAAISLDKPKLVIESSRASVVNGTAHISKGSVGITLNFRKNDDCTGRAYVCELQYSGAKGGTEIVSETVTPGEQSGDCSCSSITEQFEARTNAANAIDRQASTQRRVNGNINSELQNLRQIVSEKKNTVDKLRDDSTLFNEAINTFIQDHKDYREDIAAQSHTGALLTGVIGDLQSSGNNQQQALAEQLAKDEANDVVIADLTKVDITVTAAIKERGNKDAKFDEDIKQIIRRDGSLENQAVNVRRTQSSLQEEVLNVRQGNDDNANDIRALKKANEARKRNIVQLSSDFDTQETLISNLQQADANFRSVLNGIDQNNTASDSVILILRRRIQQYQQKEAALRQKDQMTFNQLGLLSSSDAKIEQGTAELEEEDTLIQQQIDDLTGADTQISGGISTVFAKNVATTGHLTNLRAANVVLLNRISNQSLEYQSLEVKVLSLTERNMYLFERLAKLSEKLVIFQHYIQASHVTTLVRTTTKLSQVQCTRGMVHVDSRVRVLVSGTIPAICDAETDGGGWLVILSRVDNTVNFNRTWDDYKEGFGTITGNYWIGLKALKDIVDMGFTDLRVDFTVEGTDYFANYILSVGSEDDNYRLSVSGYSGDAGDSLSYHNNMAFSTKDQDNDRDDDRNCAVESGGGGWFDACYKANLFGVYGGVGPASLVWSTVSPSKAVTKLEVKVRAAGNVVVSSTQET